MTDCRVAERGDRASLLSLLRAQLDEHAIAIADDALAAAVDGALADPGRGLFVLARHEGHDVGVAYLSFNWTLEHGGRSAWLEELYVAPALRARGLGTALLHAAVGEAAARGCRAVDLEVEAGHARAARLYEREGFRLHRRQRWVRKLT